MNGFTPRRPKDAKVIGSLGVFESWRAKNGCGEKSGKQENRKPEIQQSRRVFKNGTLGLSS